MMTVQNVVAGTPTQSLRGMASECSGLTTEILSTLALIDGRDAEEPVTSGAVDPIGSIHGLNGTLEEVVTGLHLIRDRIARLADVI